MSLCPTSQAFLRVQTWLLTVDSELCRVMHTALPACPSGKVVPRLCLKLPPSFFKTKYLWCHLAGRALRCLPPSFTPLLRLTAALSRLLRLYLGQTWRLGQVSAWCIPRYRKEWLCLSHSAAVVQALFFARERYIPAQAKPRLRDARSQFAKQPL